MWSLDVTAPPPTDAEEAAARQAVEAAWIRFWDYYPTIEELTPAQRVEILDAVSVEPLKSKVLRGAESADAGGRTGYGTVSHTISWIQAIDGADTIVIADCMDQSLMGSADRATGEKLTHGYERTHLRGNLIYDKQTGWRVRDFLYVSEPPC